MDSQTDRLVEKFNLTAAVEEFVRRRVRELSADKQFFAFRGSCKRCGKGSPHIPHSTGGYETVRYGYLSYFCPGLSGDGLEIVTERQSKGSPDFPGSISGYWTNI